ncbi:MAG: adaptor protein MecA [Parasporobacterium sp.]|nr:adaptor protein MecA [Parasporobacterium sp.]
MKIEKISDNQIKCTLTRSDLASRQLKLSELAYGTEKANTLFRDMMDQANLEFGFDTSDLPIMIEAIPVSMDCIILMITKVEDPDEVDTRYSSLSSLKDVFSRDSAEDFSSTLPSELLQEGLFRLGEFTQEASAPARNIRDCVVSFHSLDAVMDFSHHISLHFNGESALYKSPEDGAYYLHMHSVSKEGSDFAYISTAALEFGKDEAVSPARLAYMNEHFEKILEEDAVQSLAYV